MSSHLLALAVDARDPTRVGAFWGALLRRPAEPDHRGVLLRGSDVQVGLRFVASASVKVGRDPVHLHLTSQSLAAQADTVAYAIDLGARHLDVGQRPEEGHVVLTDPEGNEFCVIEPGNAYLAGCGFLGELACGGGRPVGWFWSAALDWPLVWDEGEETAIQSPAGGTKIGWGGPDDGPPARSRQRLELTVGTADRDAEVDRLVALGATHLGSAGDAVELADPEGGVFVVVS